MPAAKKTKRSTNKKPGVARKRAAPAPSLQDALAEAAWAEADAALAQALADLDEAQSAPTAAERREAMELLAQSLGRAARKRGFTRLGDVGERTAFDPARHELSNAGAKKPKTVRIAARGVARGAEVLALPRVRPDKAKKRARKKKTS